MDYLFLLSFTTVKRVFCLSVRLFTGVKGMFDLLANDFTAMEKAFGFSVRLSTLVKYLYELTFLLFTGENGTNIRNVFLFITCLVASIFLSAYKTIYFITSFCMVIFTQNNFHHLRNYLPYNFVKFYMLLLYLLL